MNALPWRRLLSTATVACGLGLVWLVAIAWLGALLFSSQYGLYESISATAQGELLIQTRNYADYDELTFRTLDGKRLDKKPKALLSGVRLPSRPVAPGLYDWPISWNARLGGLTNYSEPRILWYAVRDDKRPGHAYFEGFEATTNRAIGYVSRKGFHRNRPAQEECFDLGDLTFSWPHNVLAASEYFQAGVKARAYSRLSDARWLLDHFVYIKDGDVVREFDMAERSVRAVAEVPGLTALQLASDYFTPGESKRDEGEASGESKKAPKRELRTRVVARGDQSIVLYDPQRGETDMFAIPASILEKDFDLFPMGPEQLLASIGPPGTMQRTVELVWFDKTGAIKDQRSVELAGFSPENPNAIAWMFAGVGPLPAAWAIGVGAVAPLGEVQNNLAPTYAAGLRHVLSIAGAPMIAVGVLGVTLALAVIVRHRRAHRPHVGAWATLVFLLGPAGLIAYWLEHRSEPRTVCDHCGGAVPRNREACPACRAPWTSPAPLGTEIFAA